MNIEFVYFSQTYRFQMNKKNQVKFGYFLIFFYSCDAEQKPYSLLKSHQILPKVKRIT